MMCNPPRTECCLGNCDECKDTYKLETKLIDIFEELDVDEISYKQWESTDRTVLVNITESSQDFVQSLLAKLEVLKKHQFINSMQVKFFMELKENLPRRTVLAVGDFSENYSFV